MNALKVNTLTMRVLKSKLVYQDVLNILQHSYFSLIFAIANVRRTKKLNRLRAVQKYL